MGYTNFINNGQPAINDTNLNNMQKELMKLVFPIGATYITQSADTNPSTILEFGTWERVKGRVLVGIDEDDSDFATFGQEGGEKTHTLTVNEMPNHNHPANGTKDLYLMNDPTNSYAQSSVQDSGNPGVSWGKTVASQGGNQPHNNLQPYKVVGYMWIRIS